MFVIVVANQKGGVGKQVLIIDTDIQESSISFRAIRQSDDIKSVSIKTPTLHKDIDSFENFDIVMVDAGGRDDAVFRSSILSASKGILIIPTLPSVYDLWATEDTLKILEEAKVYADINTYILLNQVIKANIVKETEESLRKLIAKYDVNLLNSRIFSRVVYRNCIKEGKGVMEMDNKKAKQEMEQLTTEISNITNIS